MTLNASTARWRPRVRSRWIALACKTLLLLVGVLLAAQYLAGFLFLQWVHSDPKTATPLTVARYGYYFGERADIRRKLWISSGAGLALVMFPVILALRPRAGSQREDHRKHDQCETCTGADPQLSADILPLAEVIAVTRDRQGRRRLRIAVHPLQEQESGEVLRGQQDSHQQ